MAVGSLPVSHATRELGNTRNGKKKKHLKKRCLQVELYEVFIEIFTKFVYTEVVIPKFDNRQISMNNIRRHCCKRVLKL